MMETRLFDPQGQEIGKAKLADQVFNQTVNKWVLWESITAIRKNQRSGLAKTKNRAEVRGGGAKPWRQKGIGWARHGSRRSPIWRGGGVVFGPKPRDYSSRIPKKKKKIALLSSLSAKAKENKVLVIEEFKLDSPKTKNLVEILKNINLNNEKILIGVEKIEKNLKLASRNIKNLSLKRVQDINSYDILSCNYLLLTNPGLKTLEKRCVTKE